MSECHNANGCQCLRHIQPAQQTLTELEFERGIWNAAIHNEIDRIKNFIATGHTMDRDNCAYTALHYAARGGHEEICKLLVNVGKAEVNAVTKGGATALHRAAMMGHIGIVKFLLEADAIVELQDDDGQTALHRSAARGHLEICKCLSEKQPTLRFIRDKKDKIPFEYLGSNANDDFKILLKPLPP